MKSEEFAAAVVLLIEDDTALARGSPRDLAVLGSVLEVLAERVNEELARREAQTTGARKGAP